MKPLYIALISIGASMLLGFVVFHFITLEYVFRQFYARVDMKKLNKNKLEDAYYDKSREKISACKSILEKMPKKEITITSEDGLKLFADYFDQGKEKTAIMLHGFHSLALNNFSVVAKSLLDNGYNVLFPYQRAHGKSDGKYTTYGKMESGDLLRWIDYISENTETQSIMIYGTSMGGSVVGITSEMITSPKVKVLVLDCAFTTLKKLLENIIKEKNLPGKMFVPGLKRKVKRRLNMTFTDLDASESLKNNKIPTLFIYGTNDNTVSRECTDALYSACASDKELILVEGSGHAVAFADGGQEVIDKFYNFVEKYI